MRISSLLTLTSALLMAPTAVSAAGRLGFTLGPQRPDGSCKEQRDFEEDFDAIKAQSGSTLVRSFSSSDCNIAQTILPAAKAKDFQVMLAVWPDTEESFQKDKQALQKYATEEFAKQLYGVIVGSEVFYRGNFTGEQLLDKINDIKRILPKGVKCGPADTWNKLADGTADAVIRGGADLFLVNGFAYWQAQPITNASATYFYDMASAIAHIQTVAGGPDKTPEIFGGETGWPSKGGTNYGPAEASDENAATYFSQSVCGMLTWGVNLFYFSAMDEPGKPDSVGENGQSANEKHWGAMTADRKAKYDLSCK
ncbi:beta-glucosidase [Phyllosticta citribraziliensis]|uniref:glucan 1,3-beta-glucosidase n=1 Tax=Phyllosticta citribraziliensis TaxID=989973 RepID=A0ABR1LLG1_9PEZI